MLGCLLHWNLQKKFLSLGLISMQNRIEMMKKGIDPSNELDKEAFESCDIVFTNSLGCVAGSKFFYCCCSHTC